MQKNHKKGLVRGRVCVYAKLQIVRKKLNNVKVFLCHL